ncbi:HAD family hydrolase [Streptomyces lavendulae]|uniref:HAD family hydrolase n=1 Tax=Streptomyces lavendulae TaxID=1914 RepID=UPI003824DFC2
MIRTVVLDVSETLTHDDRHWGDWADWLGVPRHTVRAGRHRGGRRPGQRRRDSPAPPERRRSGRVRRPEAAGRGERLDESDLYEDVRPALSALQSLGVRVVVAGNQSAKAGDLLRALSLPADLVVTSAEWGAAKPSPDLFHQVVGVAQAPAGQTLYVGDHPANDVFPAAAVGLMTAHLRRGPWGHWWADDETVQQVADYSIDSLLDLPSLVNPGRRGGSHG